MADGYPTNWRRGSGEVIATKTLDAFTHVDVVYDYQANKYRVWWVNVDGPLQRQSKGSYDDLGQAFRRGDEV